MRTMADGNYIKRRYYKPKKEHIQKLKLFLKKINKNA